MALGVTPVDLRNNLIASQEDTVDPHWLDGVFARVATAGGIENYLAQNAVVQSDLAALRAQALD
jgi:hypothetical protein